MLRPAYPLVTDRLHLRPFMPGDLDALEAIHGDAGVVRYLYWDVRTRAELRGVLAEKQQRHALVKQGDSLNLAAVLPGSAEVVGDVTLMWHSEEHRQGEIGYILHPAHQGKGYATEATRALLRIGFDELGLHRIAGRLDGRNTASARVLERVGMRREACFVENEQVKGEWTDEVVYALLEREWRASLTRVAAASAP
ncbi:MAG TPA: GNAT family protein [Solirubrobacteraceae bacterium]|nr:GNAT family protein [Solirubrobacteraceae bacterium]